MERYHRCLAQWRIADNVCKHHQVGWTNELELRRFGGSIMLEVIVEIVDVSRHAGGQSWLLNLAFLRVRIHVIERVLCCFVIYVFSKFIIFIIWMQLFERSSPLA